MAAPDKIGLGEKDSPQELDDLWRAAFESNPTMYFIVDAAGGIVSVNPFGAEQLGYTVSEMVGQPVLNVFHESDRGAVQEHAKTCFEQPGRMMRWEARKIRKDGAVIWVRETANSVVLQKRHVLLVVCEDITEQKRAEAEIDRLHHLEIELAQMNRVSMMGELAASLAHELKQAITAAATNAKTSLRWMQREPPDMGEAREAVSRVIKDVIHASEVIDRNRSLYRRDTPKRETVTLNELVREMVVLLNDNAQQHSVSIRAELSEPLPTMAGDRVQLQQVLMNLMLNGIEAMKDSGGELTIRSKMEDGQIVLSVSDAGMGLPENANRIFDPFFTTKEQGTGMGLSISRRIVESHGGKLWATENAGRGATFHFTLPTAPSTSSAA